MLQCETYNNGICVTNGVQNKNTSEASVMNDFYHYLPVDDTVIQWGLYLTGAGIATVSAGVDYPPKGHPGVYEFRWDIGRTLPEFQILVITDGHGIFESEQTGKIAIEPDTVMILFPGVWHRYRPDKQTGWTERWISLNGTIPHYLTDQRYLSPDRAICQIDEPTQLLAAFDSILDSVDKKPTDNTLLTSLNAMPLITEVIEKTGGNVSPDACLHDKNITATDDPLVASALDMIWTHSHRAISVGYLLSQLPTTRRTLERRFKKACGRSINDEIIQCRLSRATRLLRETHLPVKTVAYLSGFGHPEKMRYAFENNLGQTPSNFRGKQQQ
jgi:AraC-like DNA-binding protein